MQIQPIIFLVFLTIFILIALFFIIKGIRTGKMFTRFQSWADKKENPITFWFYMVFDSLLLIFFLVIYFFIIRHYLL